MSFPPFEFRGVPAAPLLLILAGIACVAGPVIFALDAAAQTTTVRGFVTDASDGQALPGANVTLTQPDGVVIGAVADRNGFYQVGGVHAGRYHLRISFVGYRSFEQEVALGEDPLVTISTSLVPGAEALDEIVVEEDRGAVRQAAGQQIVRAEDLERIPTPDLSGDLASYLQSMPGVVSVGDRGGRLYVRGGTPAQNLVLVDGNLIYQPFHIVGFFSAFPQDLISSVDVLAGGFGARYSGRVSSVIDVTTRHGNTETAAGSFSASPFIGTARVEGPLHRGRSSYLASYRLSLIDRIAPTVAGTDIPVNFSDLFLKLYRTDQDNSRCSATLIRTTDRGRTGDADEFSWMNFVLGGRCLTFPATSAFLFDGNAGISYVGNHVGSPARPDRSSGVVDVRLDLNFTYPLARNTLRWGIHSRAQWTHYSLGGQYQGLEGDSDAIIAAGAYGELSIRRGRLDVTPGLSLTVHPFLFAPSVEPRLRLSWQPNLLRGGTFSGAAGLYRQVLAGITDERDAGSLFIAWMPAPIGTVQTSAVHGLVGWQQPVSRWVTASAEAYYKRMSNLHVPIWSTIARFTTTLQLADGTSYGYDARLELDRGPFFLFAGYGFSVTEYEAAQENFGSWYGEPVQSYHPPHDLRHQLTLLAGFRWGRTHVNAMWQYGSGLPYTRVLGFDELVPLRPIIDYRRFAGTTRVLFEKPYLGRLPAYHRLDFSVERSFEFARGTMTLQVGAVNSYDRSNIFYLDIFTLDRVDQLPLVPYGGMKVDLR